jgi:hypothetical protein
MNWLFIIAAIVVLFCILMIPVYAYFQNYVFPPRELALRVAGMEYSRGDVVNFIRFNQRMRWDLGVPFEVGNSLFDALQTLQENELAFHYRCDRSFILYFDDSGVRLFSELRVSAP